MSFDNFGLHAVLLANLRQAGFTTPTPVQEQAIPPVLEGLDVMACAQTGTGKTAAFVLPGLHRILSSRPRNNGNGPRLLVLTPTRELAQQVAANVKLLAPADRLRVGVVVGGMPYPPQNRLLNQRLDVLVATPGRLIDHLQEGRVDLSRVDVLVLDEADRMLDMGFQKPVERIVAETPEDRQTLLFSATFSDGVRKIGRHLQKSPVMVELAPVIQRHDNIEQSVIQVDDRSHKLRILENLLRDGKVWQAIVFVGTKRYADTLADKLNDHDIPCAALHGDMRQSARRRTLDGMHNGKLRVLVATDVAARGIDVKDLSHVFNFDLPQVAEDYVHRIGRTGRAGAKGEAVSLVSPQDVGMLREIEKLLAMRIERRSVEGMESRQSEGAFDAAGYAAAKGKGRGGKPQGGNKSGGNRFGKFAKSERSSSDRSSSRFGGGDRDRFSSESRGEKRFDSRSERGNRSEGRFEQRSEKRSNGNAFVNPGKFAPRRDESLDTGWGGKAASSGYSRDRNDSRDSRDTRSSRDSKPQGKSFGKSFGKGGNTSSSAKPTRFGQSARTEKKGASSWGKPSGGSRGKPAGNWGNSGNKSSLRRRGASA